jgi:hypothetical protein
VTARLEKPTFAALAAAVVVILVLWVYPGYLAPSRVCPMSLTAHHRTYCAESVALEPTARGAAEFICSGGFDFQGVQFELDFSWDGTLGDVAGVGGWINSSHLGCVEARLFGDPLGPRSVNWTSTDGSVYLQWNQPFESLVGGTYVATILCGVYVGA